MAVTSTDPVKRASFPAAVGLAAVIAAVWQPHPYTAIHSVANTACVSTNLIPAPTVPGAQHTPTGCSEIGDTSNIAPEACLLAGRC